MNTGILTSLVSFITENYMYEIQVVTVVILAVLIIMMAYEGELGEI